MQIEVKARKWGDSIGVVIPRTVVETENIKPNDKLTVILAKQADLSEFFGTFKTRKTGQQLKDEAREIWNG